MVDIILMSHGKLASGLKSSVEVITGKQDKVHAIDMYLDEEKLVSKLEKIIKEKNINLEDTIIMTDVIGGSVNQEIIKYVDLNKTFIISGMNLALLLSLVTSNLSLITFDDLEKLVVSNKEQIQVVNKVLDEISDDFDLMEK